MHGMKNAFVLHIFKIKWPKSPETMSSVAENDIFGIRERA